MTNIRRYFAEGQINFLTHVTSNRSPLLIDNIDLFWEAYEFTCGKTDTDLIAWVILPDHTHLLIKPNSNNMSDLMKRFKQKFSGLYRSRHHLAKGRIWQYRYWDHIIRDQTDFNRHVDYIHYNPVKHVIVKNPREYGHSSINKYIEAYPVDWGIREKIDFGDSFGE
jgi:putative transposase